ncbi:(2Fe-2S)-binding protein [Roseococcus sp. YIM B11640]|uniref:(2Fe-2S)-binding protein n=1 Tax=Roseococcus sp. YIM B11640 TaxID=3133973 RepID=UPI003C7CBC64
MVICLCNGMSDGDVRAAVSNGATRPKEVYEGCNCQAQCGTCTAAILGILRDLPDGKPQR